jgi:hypothetical protein
MRILVSAVRESDRGGVNAFCTTPSRDCDMRLGWLNPTIKAGASTADFLESRPKARLYQARPDSLFLRDGTI